MSFSSRCYIFASCYFECIPFTSQDRLSGPPVFYNWITIGHHEVLPFMICLWEHSAHIVCIS